MYSKYSKYQRIVSVISRCKKEGLNRGNLGLLSAMINDDKGLTAKTRGDLAEAAVQYKLALASAASANPRLKSDYIGNSVQACHAGLVTGAQCP